MDNNEIILEWLESQPNSNAQTAAETIRSLLKHNAQMQRKLEELGVDAALL
jgi:hypothetical protein